MVASVHRRRRSRDWCGGSVGSLRDEMDMPGAKYGVMVNCSYVYPQTLSRSLISMHAI